MKPAHRSGASVTGMLVKVFLAGVLILLALSFVSFVGGRAVHQFVTRHRGEAPAVGAERAKVDPRWSEAFSSEWEAVLEPRAAYDAGDYGAAYEGFLPFAGHGNAVAQYNLGVMFARGHGVPTDYVQAQLWLDLAA